MLVLGIDPGTATTGYGFVRDLPDGSLEAVEFGVFSTPATMSMPERLSMLYKNLREKILLYHPQSGAVEKLFFQRNVTTAMTVGQARGVVMLAFAQNGLEVAEYTPLEIKQAVTGYGGADKKQIQQMVKALLNLEQIPRPDDAADALAIAICHLHSARLGRLIAEG